MDKSGPSPAMRFGCASTAACIAEAITFPMEAIIIRMQIQTGTSLGMVGMLSSMVKHEGVGVLWRGVSPAMWRQVLCGGVGVGLYPVVRGSLVPEGGELQLYHRIIAGSTTGSFAQFLAQPLDVIKVRLQADAKLVASGAKPQYRGMVDTAAKIWATEGASGFFLGLTPSLFRAAAQYVNVCFFSLSSYFSSTNHIHSLIFIHRYGAGVAAYDQSKAMLIRNAGLGDNMPTHVAASLMSGFCTAVAGTPGDVLKTRMIAQLILKSGTNYTSTLDCLTTTLREGGPRAMYKGFLPTVRMHACAHKLAPRLDRSIVSSLSSLLKRSHSPLPSSTLSLSLFIFC